MSREDTEDKAAVAATVSELVSLERQGRLAECVTSCQAALDAFEPEDPSRCVLLRILGSCEANRGAPDEARAHLQASRELAQKLRDREAEALALAELAQLAFRRGDRASLELAEQQLQQASRLLEQQSEAAAAARGRLAHYRAVLLLRRGQPGLVLAPLMEAHACYQDLPAERSRVLDTLGSYALHTSQFRSARRYFELSLTLKREVGDRLGECITAYNLAKLLIDQEQHEDAAQQLEAAIAVAREIGNRFGLPSYLQTLAYVRVRCGAPRTEIEPLLAEAGELDPPVWLATMIDRTRALLEARQGRSSEAIELLLRAAEQARAGQAPLVQGMILRDLGTVLKGERDLQRASDVLRQSIEVLEDLPGADRQLVLGLVRLAECLIAADDARAAEQLLDRALWAAQLLGDGVLVGRVQAAMASASTSGVAAERQPRGWLGDQPFIRRAFREGCEEEATVLFSDIQGFSTQSIGQSPDAILHGLEGYFRRMVAAVHDNDGYLDKLMGDGLMAIFRGETERGHHALRAATAAREMIDEALPDLNWERAVQGLGPFRIRVGLSSGPVTIGNVGAYRKMELTAIGEAVNLAQRMESIARADTVRVTEATYAQLDGHFIATPFRDPVKGYGAGPPPRTWELQQRLPALRFRSEYVGPGEDLSPQPGKIALDVGNRCEPGVIDHHQRGAGKECTASLIYERPRLVLDHLAGEPAEQITLRLHRAPDLDAVAAVFFVRSLVAGSGLPRAAGPLAEYVRQIDAGSIPDADRLEATLYGIYQGIAELVRRRSLPADEAYDLLLVRGLALLEHVCDRLEAGLTLQDPELLPADGPFARERDLVVADRETYTRGDLARARTAQLQWPDLGPVDLVAIESPESFLFPRWARADSNSPGKSGYGVVVVHPNPGFAIISVDPGAGLRLEGLGAALEQLESEKREQLGQPRRGPPRPGYDSADPWYDGRGDLHAFTIVAAPRGGTLLTAEEVESVVRDRARWARDRPQRQ